MRSFYRLAMIISLLAALLSGTSGAVMAQAPTPQFGTLPEAPVTSSDGLSVSTEAALTSSSSTSMALPSLKAVLVVGAIDETVRSDGLTWTQQEINNMELAAKVLEANGVTVYRFYSPNNNWDQIKAAAQGAHFFFYRGHGISWGGSPINVGGLALYDHTNPDGSTSYNMIHSDRLQSELDLADNAIVMMYACYSAGSSGGEMITLSEAQRRVAQYSGPFMNNGAAAYYANWFGNAFEYFVHYLFEGQTLAQAYQSFYDYPAGGATVEKSAYPGLSTEVLWLDHDAVDQSGKATYHNAFAGKANETLASLFSTMTINQPSSITLLSTPSSASRTIDFGITITGANQTWTSSLVPAASWVNLSKTTGVSGDTIQVTLDAQGLENGTYTTTLRIAATNPYISQGEQNFTISMVVVDQIKSVFIPFTTK